MVYFDVRFVTKKQMISFADKRDMKTGGKDVVSHCIHLHPVKLMFKKVVAF